MAKEKRKLVKISIVIPSYNKAPYLAKTLDSIVKQNYENMEVIIQDGGSNDGSVEIMKKYAKKYKFLKWESKKDNGQTDAIVKGLQKATGEVLTFINADDVFKPNALKLVAKSYEKNPDALWFAGLGDIINEDDKQISKLVTSYKNKLIKLNRLSLLLCVNYLTQPAVFINKKAYKKYGPFEGVGRIVMEYGLWLKLGKVEMPVVIPNYLASFRLASDNLSVTSFGKILTADMNLAKQETGNPIVLGIHYLHNVGRVMMAQLGKL